MLQGTWKRKDGRPVLETLRGKINFERPDGTESSRKQGKTIDMLELISTAKVSRLPYQAQ